MSFVRVKATGGDWKLVPNLLRKIKESVFGSRIDRTTKKASEFIATKIREGIESGRPGGQQFTPLADATIRRKGHPRPLIWTRSLLDSIQARRIGKARYRIGPDPKTPHPMGTELAPSIADVGDLHENGGGAGGARPFIQPVLDEIQDEVEATFFKGIDNAIDARKR